MYGELRVAGSGTFGWADMTLAGWSNMTLAQWSAMTLNSTGGMAISYDNGLSYDPVGNRQTASDASGNVTTYSYDPANQLTQSHARRASPATATTRPATARYASKPIVNSVIECGLLWESFMAEIHDLLRNCREISCWAVSVIWL